MTYIEMSDREIIDLLEGKTQSEVLSAMSAPAPTVDYKTIDDIFMEIMEMAQTTN